MSFVWNPLTSALNPSLDLDLRVFRWWLVGLRGRMRPKALDSIHKQHLGTDKWYQFKIKRLELILGLSSASALGERLWVFALLSRLAWVIVLILRPGGGNLSPVSSKMMLFSDIFCLFFYFNQWFNCFRVYESSAFGCILPLCLVNHHQWAAASGSSLENYTSSTMRQQETTRHNKRQHEYKTTQHETTEVQHDTTGHDTSATRHNMSKTQDNKSTKQHKIYFDLFILLLYTQSLVY